MPQFIDEEEFKLDPEKWYQAAQDYALAITEKGVPKVYLLSKEVFDSLYHGSRQALSLDELSPDEVKALRESKMSAKYDYLNALMEEDDE